MEEEAIGWGTNSIVSATASSENWELHQVMGTQR